MELKKKRIKITLKVGSFNKDYIDEEYGSKSSSVGYTRIKVNKLEENNEPLSDLNLAYAENADTTKTKAEGWNTRAD